MISRRFYQNKCPLPLYWLYVLLTCVTPDIEHEELRGEMEESYWCLLDEQSYSRTGAILQASWAALMYVRGMHYDNIFFKTGSFEEEALKLKNFLQKSFGFLCILVFPILFFAQGAQQTLVLVLGLAFVGWLCASFEWTFNHKSALEFFGILTGLGVILPLLIISLIPEQRQAIYYLISAIGFTNNLWIDGLSVFILILSMIFLYYLTMWLILGVPAYLVAGSWYSRSIFFK